MKLFVFLMHSLIFSRAIMTYLANQYAPNSSLYPKDAKKRAVIDRVLQFDQATLYYSFGDYIARPVIRQGKGLKDLDPEKEKKVREALKLLDDSLANQKYVAGNELTLADLSVLASMTVFDGFNYDYSEFKNITEWNNRLKSELPYYDEVNKEAMEMLKQFIAMKLAQAEKK
jgi:glutathione S-transferase